ncbi:hypothetical protein Hanom_Chr12g01102291 [Helianthus anomalus]
MRVKTVELITTDEPRYSGLSARQLETRFAGSLSQQSQAYETQAQPVFRPFVTRNMITHLNNHPIFSSAAQDQTKNRLLFTNVNLLATSPSNN